MKELDAWRNFAETGSETALSAVIRQHLPLVYGVALRRTQNNSLLAQDIAQETFCLFVKKAAQLPAQTVLSGWLCRTALHLSQRAVRTESRRRAREQEALAMHNSTSDPGATSAWEQISPEIDAALDELPEGERSALVLRFYEHRAMRELGAALGISEDAAKMRVSRGLSRLREILLKRGIPVTTAALAALLADNLAAAPVPAGVAHAIERNALRAQAKHGAGRRLLPRPTSPWLAWPVIVGLFLATPALLRRTSPRHGGEPTTPPPMSVASPAEAAGVAAPAASFDFAGAAAALRKALRDPWISRKPPFQRIDEAIAAYGKYRRMAAPVLMEMLLGERKAHTYESQVLAAHGLLVLGPDAAETLDDLVILHRSGDLNFLAEKEAELFAAVDLSGATIPEFMRDLGRGDAIPPVDILIPLLRQNPGIAPAYREALMELANSPGERGLPALIVAARVPSLADPDLVQPLIDLVRKGAALNWRASFDKNPIEEFTKPWLRPAILALQELRPAEAINPLMQLARTEALPGSIRDSALAAAADLAANAAGDLPELQRWRTAHAEGERLAGRISDQTASLDDLMAGLEHRESVSLAAVRLSEDKGLAIKSLPQLLRAIETFEDADAIACLPLIPTADLVHQLAVWNTDGLRHVAERLSQITPPPMEALPLLEQIVDHLDQSKASITDLVIPLETAIVQLNRKEARRGFGTLFFGNTIENLDETLSSVARKNPDWQARLFALQAYLKGKLICRASVVRSLLREPLQDPELRDAFTSAPSYRAFEFYFREDLGP